MVHDTFDEQPQGVVPRSILTDAQESESGSRQKLEKSDAALQYLSPKPWKPAYLENRRLVIFPILCSISIVAIQVLIHVSQLNDGLTTSNKNLHYLWTFGPMATLTLLAAFWTRVEFQIKCISPWAHMIVGDRAEKTLLLDYLSMLQPIVVVRAVKVRDRAVAFASLCSLILRVTIIFSTALISLTQTTVHNTNVPVTLRSSFVDSAANLGDIATNLGALPYYSMRGLSERNIPFPDGTWNNYAFQQFVPTEVPDTQLGITVEGFTSSLFCEPASLNTSYNTCDALDTTGLCWALETKQCQFPIHRMPVDPGTGRSDDRPPSYYGRIGLSGCNNSENVEDIGIYMLFGRSGSNNENLTTSSDPFSPSSQIVCRASYAISQVEVISNQTGIISVSNSSTANSRQIEGLKDGRMLDLYLRSFETATSTSSMDVTIHLQGETGEPEDAGVDLYFADALSFSHESHSTISDLLKESTLEKVISRHYQQATVFIGRSVFSTQTGQNITGTMDLKKERLLVSIATGHTMTALLSVATILSVLVMTTKPRLSSLPKNPNSVLETAQLLADSKEVLSLLSGAGPASLSTMTNRLRDFQFKSTFLKSVSPSGSATKLFRISASSNQELHELHYLNAPAKVMRAPFVLNLVSMVGVQLLIVGAIVALEIIIRVSGDKHDFVDVSDQQYLHFAWTILPALFMSLISMYYAAVDSETRYLTPYSKLSKGSSLGNMIDFDLLDGSTPRLLWREYRSESLAALSTTLCMLAASFLTIFVGSLYSVVTLPIDTPIQLQTESSFNITRSEAVYTGISDMGQRADFSSLTSTLILDSNLSYPAFTYEALAFPEFSIVSTPQNLYISSSDVINATVPALRSKMSCTRYSSSEIQMEIISASIPGVPASHQAIREILAINIDGEEHQSITIPNGLTHNMEIPLNTRPDVDWIFGFGDSCKGNIGLLWCTSDFLYVWGHKTNSTNQTGNHVAALACNESIEAVSVFTTFLGSRLSINPSFPPFPINDSTRESTVNVHSGNHFESDNWLSPYQYLAAGVAAPGTYLWPFFDALTTSRYAIPLADLDNMQKDDDVARAIVAQHGILRAQVLNEGFRGPANATNATLVNPPVSTKMANDSIAYNGTLRSSIGRRRLAQDPVTTRVLEALLVMTLVLSAAGRLLMQNTKLLPRNPTSIANVAALVADGNIGSILPENSQLLSEKDVLATVGRKYILRLGWWTRTPEDASSRRFGIFAIKTSEESMFD
ncbi:hypothetical protein F4679DRAFT_593070 [Xylaria curta]|nr:hypothetical protein F4679DRAFT_593070 [Xylaria curta]